MATRHVDRMDSGAAQQLVDRVDFQRIDAARVSETPQGFLRVQGNLTRTGVLKYTRADGSTYRELRLPEEVFRADSLDSLKMAPVTDLHGGMVTPENVGKLQVGMVAEDVRQDGKFVVGTAIVQKADAIADVRSGKRCELSPGYRCWVEDTSGEYEGERYDGIQRGIVYNHLAIGPVGWGRSGPEVALRLDGLGEGAAYATPDGTDTIPAPPPRLQQQQGCKLMKIKIVLDSGTFEVEVPDALATTFSAGIEKLQATAKTETARADKLDGELVSAKKEGADLKTKLDAAQSPEAMLVAVAERSALEADVRTIAPELKFDAKLGSRELKVATLIEAGHEKDSFDSKTGDGFIDGAFAGELSAAKRAGGSPPTERGTRSAGAAPTTHQDGDPKTEEHDKYDSEGARDRMVERNRGLASGPLDHTAPGMYTA